MCIFRYYNPVFGWMSHAVLFIGVLILKESSNKMLYMMNTQELIHKEMNDLLQRAYQLELVSWNDGLVFKDYIPALWRSFLRHERLKVTAEKIDQKLGHDSALELLATSIDLSRGRE